MGYTIIPESFASLTSHWSLSHDLRWGSIFVLPSWLEAWWQAFGGESELCLQSIRQGNKIIGIAPLLIRGQTASIVGSANVCDYIDFVIAPGVEKEFFTALLDYLGQKGVSRLDLRPLRHDSTVITHLVGIAQKQGHEVLCLREGVSLELGLPSSWEDYLSLLDRKQRHELRRKLRRLKEAGSIDYRCFGLGHEAGDLFDTFLKLFSLSDEGKAKFMTPKMACFFRSVAEAMTEIDLLRFGVLHVDQKTVAIIMTFEYLDSMYLYNSAYNPQYAYLSVGLLSKLLCIKECIDKGKSRFDFLWGGERYKYQLGGQEIPLYRCQIEIR